MSNKSKFTCLHCNDEIVADVRNRGRQKYCAKPDCQRESKAASQRRWLEKPENRYQFKDAENATRAREWQQAHPGYWKNTTRYKRRTLQETSPPKALITFDKRIDTSLLLQEVLSAPGPLLIGLIATLGASPLQEDIARTSRRFVQLGQEILSSEKTRGSQTSAAP